MLGVPSIVPALGVAGLGLLMVSPIPYHSFKNVRFGRSNSATVIPVIISLLLILEPGLNFFLVGIVYVLSGPAGYVWRAKTGRELPPVEPGKVHRADYDAWYQAHILARLLERIAGLQE